MVDPEILKHEVGTEAANETDVSTLSKPAVTPSTGNQFVAGFGDESKSEESSRDAGANNPQQIQAVDGENAQERKKPGIPFINSRIFLQIMFFYLK